MTRADAFQIARKKPVKGNRQQRRNTVQRRAQRVLRRWRRARKLWVVAVLTARCLAVSRPLTGKS